MRWSDVEKMKHRTRHHPASISDSNIYNHQQLVNRASWKNRGATRPVNMCDLEFEADAVITQTQITNLGSQTHSTSRANVNSFSVNLLVRTALLSSQHEAVRLLRSFDAKDTSCSESNGMSGPHARFLGLRFLVTQTSNFRGFFK